MSADTPREYCLYHFTREFGTVIKILESSCFLVRHCAEDFEWVTGKPDYLMVPMACFSDMPFENSGAHSDQYGSYSIVLSMDWGLKNGLQPVFYIQPSSPVAEFLQKQLGRKITKTPLTPSDFGNLWPLLPYLKPYMGSFPDGHASGTKPLVDELEWRFAYANASDSIYLRSFDEKPKETETVPPLKFTIEDIERVIVMADSEKNSLEKQFPALVGRIVTQKN